MIACCGFSDKLIVLNLKAGMPTVDQAKRRLLESLYAPRGASGPVVKVIHGYGSSGKGGAIRSGHPRTASPNGSAKARCSR